VLYLAFDLFYMDLNLVCPPFPQFAVAPLPASKLLWRAKSVDEWQREWEKEVSETSIHGILRNGDLVKLKNGIHEPNFRKAEWSRWYAGADELGMLAVLSGNISQRLH
jgi:hypothetical protein